MEDKKKGGAEQKHFIPYRGEFVTANFLAKELNKSIYYIRYQFLVIKKTGDEIAKGLKTKTDYESEPLTKAYLKKLEEDKLKEEELSIKRERIKKIMAVPVNIKKDAYLELSVKAKTKNWDLRKEVR